MLLSAQKPMLCFIDAVLLHSDPLAVLSKQDITAYTLEMSDDTNFKKLTYSDLYCRPYL
jgi:hypothetical protein